MREDPNMRTVYKNINVIVERSVSTDVAKARDFVPWRLNEANGTAISVFAIL